MKNLKFGKLNLETISILSINEKKKIIGGYGTNSPKKTTVCQYSCDSIGGGSYNTSGPPNTDPCRWYEATLPGPCVTI